MKSDLDQKLKAWNVEVETPVRFQADVWQRIAVREAAQEQSFSRRIANLFALLARPRPALAFAAMMFFAGVSVAHIEARKTNADLWRNLQTRYIVSIDPTQHVLVMQ